MSDDPTLRPDQPQSEEPSNESLHGGANDLGNELREMGQQLDAAFRAALESERAKQLQRDLAGGIRELSTQIQNALRSVQTSPRVQQAEERGRQVFVQARESKVAQDLQDTIVGGIAQLNDQLRKLVDRLENDKSAQTSNPSTQQVPIEHEPAVGETTRLDDEGKVGP